jgi:antirestriction protein ArdC
MKNSNKLYTELTEAIIALLESQTLSWNKPWMFLDEFGGMARNASSGRMYSMINQILLGYALRDGGFSKNTWLTFKQVSKLGGTVKKDAKSATIYFNTYTWKDKDKKKYSWAEVKAIPPAQREALEVKSTYFLTSYLVFNVAQTESLPEIYYQTPSSHQTVSFDIAEVVGKLINSFGTTEILTFQEIDSAFYDMKKDRIVMPLDKQFRSEAGYYGTLFHEWVHWTGHASRLNRLFLVERSKENYAHEELIAELGSVFICAQLGLAKDMTQNAAYIQSWLQALKEDSRYIMKMISYSERACRYILNEFNLEETIQEFPLEESEK